MTTLGIEYALGRELDGPTASIFYLGPFSFGPFDPPPRTEPDSRTLTVTPPFNDDDLVFDVVNVEIDGDNLPPGFRLGDKTSWRVEIVDDQLPKVSFFVIEALDVIPTPTGGLTLYPRVGEVFNVRLRIHPPNKRLDICSEYHSNGSYFDTRNDCLPDSSLDVVLHDHPKGNGGIVSIRRQRISNSEINYEVTTKKAGFYSMWIVKTVDGTLVGNIHRVSFQVSD